MDHFEIEDLVSKISVDTKSCLVVLLNFYDSFIFNFFI